MKRRSRRAVAELTEAATLAEFRRDAHTLYNKHLTGAVMLDSYLTFGGLGAALAFVAMGLYGVATAPVASTAKTGSAWLALIAVIVLALVVLRFVRLVRNARAVRGAVADLSRRMEARADAGELAPEPAGWQGPMPPVMVGGGSAWM